MSVDIFKGFPDEESIVNYTLNQAYQDNVTVFASELGCHRWAGGTHLRPGPRPHSSCACPALAPAPGPHSTPFSGVHPCTPCPSPLGLLAWPSRPQA